MMENPNDKAIIEFYPKFKDLKYRTVLKNNCTINSISRNADGDYEVYASYEQNKIKKYPILLIIGREKNKTIIKSSTGINYAFYDKTLEFGKKMGCISGNVNDSELGLIIDEKKINKFKPNILFVGMTAPKQEKWSYNNRHKLYCNYIINIGAVFDYFVNKYYRAPKIFRKIGLGISLLWTSILITPIFSFLITVNIFFVASS